MLERLWDLRYDRAAGAVMYAILAVVWFSIASTESGARGGIGLAIAAILALNAAFKLWRWSRVGREMPRPAAPPQR